MIVLRLSGRGMLTSYASSPHDDVAAAIRAARKRFEGDRRLDRIELIADGAHVCALTHDKASAGERAVN